MALCEEIDLPSLQKLVIGNEFTSSNNFLNAPLVLAELPLLTSLLLGEGSFENAPTIRFESII